MSDQPPADRMPRPYVSRKELGHMKGGKTARNRYVSRQMSRERAEKGLKIAFALRETFDPPDCHQTAATRSPIAGQPHDQIRPPATCGRPNIGQSASRRRPLDRVWTRLDGCGKDASMAAAWKRRHAEGREVAVAHRGGRMSGEQAAQSTVQLRRPSGDQGQKPE